MPSQNIMSLLVGRKAGEAAGLKDEDLGRLSMLSYFVANPVLAIVAARSMAGKGDRPDDPAIVAEAAADAAGQSAAEAKDAAGAASKSAIAAKTSADAAQQIADTIKPRAPGGPNR